MVTAAPQQEEQKSALEQYGIDLTERAREGKLDPVIGRDNEVRRVIQVQGRFAVNQPPRGVDRSGARRWQVHSLGYVGS